MKESTPTIRTHGAKLEHTVVSPMTQLHRELRMTQKLLLERALLPEAFRAVEAGNVTTLADSAHIVDMAQPHLNELGDHKRAGEISLRFGEGAPEQVLTILKWLDAKHVTHHMPDPLQIVVYGPELQNAFATIAKDYDAILRNPRPRYTLTEQIAVFNKGTEISYFPS